MNANVLKTIKDLIEAEIELAEDSIRMYYLDDEMDDTDHWVKRLAEALQARQAIHMYSNRIESASEDMSVDEYSDNLIRCADHLLSIAYADNVVDVPIRITVDKETYSFGTAAALVQGLIDALKYSLTQV